MGASRDFVVAWQDVRVGAHRDVHVRMSQPLAHDLEGHPRHADGDGGEQSRLVRSDRHVTPSHLESAVA
jgi:hypothetical protein